MNGNAITLAFVVDQKFGLRRFPALVDVGNAPVAAMEAAARFGALLIYFAAALLVAMPAPNPARFAQLVDFEKLAA